MNQKDVFRQKLDKIFLDKLIFHYFLFFKRFFNREIIDFELGRQFHNFILKFIKNTNCKIINKSNSDILVQFDGLYFIVRDFTIYYDLIRYGKFEKTTTHIFHKILKKGMSILDLGANIGYFTLIASKIIGENGKIYSFEPDPITFKYLRTNIKINHISNVELVNKCVSNKNGTITLFHHPKFHTCHSIIASPLKEAIKVESITLNKKFENRKEEIIFIKMDIEGAEMEALKGMDKILTDNHVQYLLTELNLRLIKGTGKDLDEFISFINKFFSKYFLILDEKVVDTIFFKNKAELLEFLNNFYQDNLNLLCIK